MKSNILLLVVGLFIFSPLIGSSANNKYKIKTVVIDPGHGGKDPGALGYSVAREKDIVLNVSLRLGEYIEKNFPDINVIYTRKKDVFVELHERAAIANRANADLFISIHCNSSTLQTAYGTEIYILGLHKSEENLEVSKRENSVILMEDDYVQNYDGFDPNAPEGHIIFSLFADAHMDQSIAFAQETNDQFQNRVYRKSRGVKQAGFLVLHQTTMPSILVELGFISNKNEEAFLLSEEGAVYLASALYRAFKEYKSRIELDIPENDYPVDKDTVLFKIQFMASGKKVNIGNRYEDIREYEIDESSPNVYRYLTGNFNDYKDAILYQNKLRANGLKDAFVVAFKNGKRVTINEALTVVRN